MKVDELKLCTRNRTELEKRTACFMSEDAKRGEEEEEELLHYQIYEKEGHHPVIIIIIIIIIGFC